MWLRHALETMNKRELQVVIAGPVVVLQKAGRAAAARGWEVAHPRFPLKIAIVVM
jgi:hypothetical protein